MEIIASMLNSEYWTSRVMDNSGGIIKNVYKKLKIALQTVDRKWEIHLKQTIFPLVYRDSYQ